MIASPERLAFITRLDGELPLSEIVARYYGGFDIVVAEGYKRSAPHRVELFRLGAGHAEPLCAPRRGASPWSPTPASSTSTASASRTAPAWRASSPCAWTRCGCTERTRPSPAIPRFIHTYMSLTAD